MDGPERPRRLRLPKRSSVQLRLCRHDAFGQDEPPREEDGEYPRHGSAHVHPVVPCLDRSPIVFRTALRPHSLK